MASRFVSQTELDEAAAKKAEEWKEAYARLGQAPPTLPEESHYDPRSLYERLQENKEQHQAAFEEKIALKNQFRGLDDEEAAFLADRAAEERHAEAQRKSSEAAELRRFREAIVTGPSTSSAGPGTAIVASDKSIPKLASPATADRDQPPASGIKGKAPPKGKQRAFLSSVVKTKPAAGTEKRKAPSVTAQASKKVKTGSP